MIISSKIKCILIIITCTMLLSACFGEESNVQINEHTDNKELVEITQENGVKIDEQETENDDIDRVINPDLLPLQPYMSENGFNISGYGSNLVNIWSSSYLHEDSNFSYNANQAHDFDIATAWIEGVNGYGINEILEFHISPIDDKKITHIDIINGYMKSENLWEANGRVKKLRLYIDDIFYTDLHLEDVMEVQRFSVDVIILDDYVNVRLEILEAYEGLTYEDVGISELHFVISEISKTDSVLIKEGQYSVQVKLFDEIGLIRNVRNDSVDLIYHFTKPIDKVVFEKAFENENNHHPKNCINYEWLSDLAVNIKLCNLEVGDYLVELTNLKDQDGIPMTLSNYNESMRLIKVFSEQELLKLDLETLEITNGEIEFLPYMMSCATISPDGHSFTFRHSNQHDSREHNLYLHQLDIGWIKLSDSNNKDIYFDYFESYVVWLDKDTFYYNGHIYDDRGAVIKVVNEEGFLGAYRDKMGNNGVVITTDDTLEVKIDYYDYSLDDIIYTEMLPFQRFNYIIGNRLTILPLKYFVKDSATLIVEGWLPFVEGDNKFQKPSIYLLDIVNRRVELIHNNAKFVADFGDGRLLVIDYSNVEISSNYDYSEMEGEYYILDLISGSKKKVGTNEAYQNCELAYGNYLIYTQEQEVIIYDFIENTIIEVPFSGDISILGIVEGHLYINQVK